jgi:hypothetical protein
MGEGINFFAIFLFIYSTQIQRINKRELAFFLLIVYL